MQTLRAMAEAAGYPEADLSVFEGRSLDDALTFAAEVGAEGVSTWAEDLTAADVERIHSAGLRAWVWTVNDPDRAEQLIEMGVDAICTDDPAALLARRAALVG